MHQILFLATEAGIETLEPDESPANHFPCFSSGNTYREARTQLYALVQGCFFDEAWSMEYQVRSFSDYGPFIYQLDDTMLASLARLEEDQLEELIEYWRNTEGQEDRSPAELQEFLFALIHFTQIANNDDLNLYIYSDD